MRKLFMASMAFTALLSVLLLIQLTGCKKDNTQPIPTTCDVKGTYSGTSVASTGVSSVLTYTLKENNFAVGSETPKGEAVTFGGYRNTCDSVILSVHYEVNDNYYLLEGKLSGNRNTISGTFKNLTNTSDFGTFSISK